MQHKRSERGKRNSFFPEITKWLRTSNLLKGNQDTMSSDDSFRSSEWQKSLCKDSDGRDACQWGWQKVKNEMIPLYRELVKYRYKKGSTGRCKCLKSDLECTELYQSFGQRTSKWYHVDLLHILYWFWKKSTGWYYKGVSRTTATYKVEHCVENNEIPAFCNLYFPAFGQNWRFSSNTGK